MPRPEHPLLADGKAPSDYPAGSQERAAANDAAASRALADPDLLDWRDITAFTDEQGDR